MKRILLAIVLVAVAAGPAAAQVPQTFTFAARVTDGNNALTGPHQLRFRIFPALTGGTMRWEENHGAVTLENGLVNVGLGSITPLTTTVLAGGPLWVEVELDGTAMSPRMPLRSVPYAVRATDAYSIGGLPATAFAPADILTVNAGAKLNEIAIGQAAHGALSWPYETIQLNAAHNLRFNFGTEQRMMLGNDGRLQMAQTTGDCPSGWFCNGHFWDLTVASILYSGLAQRSDRRLKEAIHPADGGLTTVRALRPVTFHWKDHRQPGLQHGFIAQDVQQVLPELVNTTPDGMLSVETTAMIPVLAQAVKELDAQNAQLRAEIAELRGARQEPGSSASSKPGGRTPERSASSPAHANRTILAGLILLVGAGLIVALIRKA